MRGKINRIYRILLLSRKSCLACLKLFRLFGAGKNRFRGFKFFVPTKPANIRAADGVGDNFPFAARLFEQCLKIIVKNAFRDRFAIEPVCSLMINRFYWGNGLYD